MTRGAIELSPLLRIYHYVQSSQIKFGALYKKRNLLRFCSAFLQTPVFKKKPGIGKINIHLNGSEWYSTFIFKKRRSFMDHTRPSIIHYKSSNLFNIRVLCGISLFIALYLVLAAFKISLSSTLRISFTFLALGASCCFFGLWPNLISAFICDFLGWLIHPDGPYVPLFAMVLMAEAAIFSFFFYGREKIGLGRVILAKGLATILCNLILNPLILSMMYQLPFWVTFSTRLVKNAVLFPVEVFLLYLVLQMCIRLSKRISWL